MDVSPTLQIIQEAKGIQEDLFTLIMKKKNQENWKGERERVPQAARPSTSRAATTVAAQFTTAAKAGTSREVNLRRVSLTAQIQLNLRLIVFRLSYL